MFRRPTAEFRCTRALLFYCLFIQERLAEHMHSFPATPCFTSSPFERSPPGSSSFPVQPQTFSSFSSGWQGDDAWACSFNVASSSSQSVLSSLKTPGLNPFYNLTSHKYSLMCRNDRWRQTSIFSKSWQMTGALNLEICHLENRDIYGNNMFWNPNRNWTRWNLCSLLTKWDTFAHFERLNHDESANMNQLSINITQTMCGVCGLLTNIE